MKAIYVILSLLIISQSFAKVTLSEAEELKKRLDLYGLTTIKEPIPLDFKMEYDTSIVQTLQKQIKASYTQKLQNKFGACADGDCLQSIDDYKSLELSDREVCLPYTQCGFYSCMEKKYQCKDQGVDYFTDLAFPTCSAYTKNIKKKWFTQKGYDWIYSVMICLQKGLIDECEYNENCKKETAKNTCEYITDFTLRFHPSCYINSGVGVCSLPLKDKINIWRTVGKYLTDRERQEAFKVVLSCIKSGN